MKTLRKYLFHLQNSVFMGEVTEKNLRDLKNELSKVIECASDSVVFFELLSDKYLKKQDLGVIRNFDIVI